MDWKHGILHIEISDAILVERCHDDLRNKITETVLKTAQKPVETLHNSVRLLPDEMQPVHRLSASSKVPGALM